MLAQSLPQGFRPGLISVALRASGDSAGCSEQRLHASAQIESGPVLGPGPRGYPAFIFWGRIRCKEVSFRKGDFSGPIA